MGVENNMEEKKEGVEKAGAAPASGVESKTTDAPSGPSPELQAILAKLEKAEKDRDNYKTGLLKAKGKLPDDGNETEPVLAEIVKQQVQEVLASTEYVQAKKAFDDYVVKTDRENRELRAALSAKNSSTSIAGGSSAGAGVQTGSEVTTEYWSPAQKEELKKRGLSEAQIKRAAELAAGNLATAPLMK